MSDKSTTSRGCFSSPMFLLRLESLVWFFLSLYLFHYFQGSWWVFIAVFLAPDLSLIGYLFSPRKGAIFYNALHVEVGPLLLAGCSVLFSIPLLLQFALIWFCHISLDRMLGIGLKYSDGFKHTHLGFFFGKSTNGKNR